MELCALRAHSYLNALRLNWGVRQRTILSRSAMSPTVSTAAGAVVVAATATATTMLIRQCRKPSGWIGRVFAQIMNRSHRELTKWGLGDCDISRDSVILDIGCGGGRTIQELARA